MEKSKILVSNGTVNIKYDRKAQTANLNESKHKSKKVSERSNFAVANVPAAELNNN